MTRPLGVGREERRNPQFLVVNGQVESPFTLTLKGTPLMIRAADYTGPDRRKYHERRAVFMGHAMNPELAPSHPAPTPPSEDEERRALDEAINRGLMAHGWICPPSTRQSIADEVLAALKARAR